MSKEISVAEMTKGFPVIAAHNGFGQSVNILNGRALRQFIGPDWIAYNEDEHGRAYIGSRGLRGGMLPGDLWHGEEQSEKWIGNDGE